MNNMPFYIFKQGYYHLMQIIGRKDIKKVILKLKKDEQNNKELIQKLELVLTVREFAQNKIHLKVKKNYRKVNLSWNKKIYGVSGCKPLSFDPYTWKYPIVGKMYIKGFYNEEDARKEKKKLVYKKYEVDIGIISAYSTLGYLEDSILGNMLSNSYPDIFLIDLIIHESVHSTIYLKNKSVFNESLAEFIAYKATQEFIKSSSFENKKEILLKYDKYRIKTEKYTKKMNFLYKKLDIVYKSESSKEDKIKKKKKILKDQSERINNAYLYSFKVYNNDTQYFETIFNYCKNKEKLDNRKNKWSLFLDEMKKIKKYNLSLKKLSENVTNLN
jgi:predicted aminopeptidase